MDKLIKNISFEFFPPKTPEGMANLQKVAEQLSNLSPNFFSVTYGAAGSTQQGTIDVVKMLQSKTTSSVAPHLTCIGSRRDEITRILLEYKKLGITRIVALRGDLPEGMSHPGELNYASELVRHIRETTGDHFTIHVAAYPECHPQAVGAAEDVLNLRKKIEAGASSAMTQYFFNADAYFYFLDLCAKQGLFAPIIPGVMPITQLEKIVRFSAICGAEIPRWLYKRLEAFGDDAESLKAFSLDFIEHLCEKLLVGGAPGLHFYTLNQLEMSMALVQRLEVMQMIPIHHVPKSASVDF